MLKPLYAVLLLVASFLGATTSEAASIVKCSAKTRRCIVRLDKGIVGDTVNVLNEKAQLVATGWLIKRKGAVGVVSFKQVFQTVKAGFPVIINIQKRGKEVKWAAAFGPLHEGLRP